MDNTHIVLHPNDRGIYVSHFEAENHFFKKIFKGMQKKVVAKTAKKAGVDATQLNKNLDAAMKKAGIDKKLKQADIASKIMLAAGATAGAIAAAPLLGIGTGGAAAAGGGTAAAGAAKSAGALGAIGGEFKKRYQTRTGSKIIDAVKTLDPKKVAAELSNTKTGQVLTNITNKLPENVKEALRNEGQNLLSKLRNDQTDPATLPKTRPQKQLEAAVQNKNGISGFGTLSVRDPLVIAGIVLLAIAVIVSITRK